MTNAAGDDFLDSIFQGIQLPPVKAEVTTEHHHVEHHEEHHDGHRHSVHHEEHHHEHIEAHRHSVHHEEHLREHHGSVHHEEHLHDDHHDHEEAHRHLEDAHHEHHHDDDHNEHHHHHEHEHIHEPALDAEPDLDADAIAHHDDGHHPHAEHVTELVIGEGVTADSPTEHILHKSEEIEHHTLSEEHDDCLHEPTAPLADDAHYETQDLVEEFFDRPVHTLEFENGIDDGDLADSETSEHIPHKHSGHDQVLEELKKRQIAQAIQEHAGDAESEPGTFNTEHVHEHEHHHHHHGVRDVDGNTSQLLGSDDEGTLHADDHYVGIESDSDVQPVKRTIKAKDNFQHELAETVHRRSENDEHVQEIKRAVESFDREQELAATRPYSLQIANYSNHEPEHDDHHHEHHQHHHDHHDAPKKAPVEPKRRTSVKKKEEQQKRDRHESEREVVVHTPLHDTIGRYSSFEPDRQDAIRKEIGQGLNIPDLMGQFEGNKHGDAQAPKPWSRKPLYELLYEDQAQDHVVDYDAEHHNDYHQHHNDSHPEVPKSRSSTLVKDKSRTNTLVKDHHHEEHKVPKSRSSTLVKDRHVEHVTPTSPLSPVALHHHHHHDHHHEHVHNGHPIENGHAVDLSNSEVLLEEQKPVNELRSKFGHRVGQKHPKPVQRTKSNELKAHQHEETHHHEEEHHHEEHHHHHVEQHKTFDHRSLRDAAERHAKKHAHRHEPVHHAQNGHVAVNGHTAVVHHEERAHDVPKSRTSTLVKEKSRASTLVKDHHEEHHHHEAVNAHEDHHHEDHHHNGHDHRYDHEDHHHHDIDQLKKVFSVAPPVAHNISHESKAHTLPNFYTHSYLKEPFQSTRNREPPVGSVAAIHKSLASIPTTPVTPPATPLSKEPELEEQSAYPSRAFGTAPKNVREFYKLWGRQAVGRKEEVPSAHVNVHDHHEHHNHHHEDHHHFNSLPRTPQIHTA